MLTFTPPLLPVGGLCSISVVFVYMFDIKITSVTVLPIIEFTHGRAGAYQGLTQHGTLL